MTNIAKEEWKFVTGSGSWLVYRKKLDDAWLFKNINKHTGEITFRRLYNYGI